MGLIKDREKRLIANLGGASIVILAITYWNILQDNSRGYKRIAELAEEGHTFRLYASCSASTEQFPPLQRGYRYVGGAVDNRGLLAETNFSQPPINIDRKRDGINRVLEALGYYQFTATFAERIKISGGLLCFPSNPFRG